MTCTNVIKGFLGFVALSAAATAIGAAPASIDGRWSNPKDSVVVDIDRCGNAWCGTVVRATAKARADAREGGTTNLIGTRLMSGFVPDDGAYKGRVFLPKRNMHAGGTIRLVGPDTLSVKGCAIAGLLCREQRWHRVR